MGTAFSALDGGLLAGRARLLALVTALSACVGQVDEGNVSPARADTERPPAEVGAGERPPPPSGSVLGARVWRLTRTQYNLTVADLLGDGTSPATAFVQEPGGTGYANAEANLGLSVEFMDQASRAAERLARETVTDPVRIKRLHECLPEGAEDDRCVAAFIGAFGRRAFRRPLRADEQGAYASFYAKNRGALGGLTTVQLIVEAMLQSPHFLFRSEVGVGAADAQGRVALTPHEVASALSYYLTGSMPDPELSAAADGGALARRDELESQARRLLETDRAKAVVWDLFRQLTGYDGLDSVTDKQGPFAATWKSAKRSLSKETESFLTDLLWSDDASFGKLFTATHTFLDKALAKLYGLPEPAGKGLEKTSVQGSEHAGLLTHAGLMSVLAHEDQSSPVLRGVFVAKKLLCLELPEPPEEVETNPPAIDAAKTTRQRYEALTEAPSTTCAACHKAQVNAAGWAFEHLDWTGRLRREENGVPVNTTGQLAFGLDLDGPYAQVADLGRKLAGSKAARACFARQVYRYASGRLDRDQDAPAIEQLVQRFEQGRWSIKELLLAHVLGDRFTVRQLVD